MRMGMVPIYFKPSANGAVPEDQNLYALAMEFCRENLAEVPDFTQQQMTYVVAELGENDEAVKIHGVTCGRPVFDIGTIRAVGPFAKQALALIGERWHSYLSDRGFRGVEVFVWIDENEKPEQQCPNRQETTKAFSLTPAKRMAVKVR